ncbi:MAG: hypothetical protein QOF14_2660 [Hyphomicrobiales bacterium]|jgi:hypothetical protein|nr:hypothetical protein [Hyphomicrobiales bacterium]
MSFGRRQPRPERAPPQAPPLQPAPAENLRHSANAASDLVALLLAAYTVRNRLDAQSAIAAAAALTGEFALRSTGVPLPERGAVYGNTADDVLYAGAREGRATAWMFMMHAAIEAGVAPYDLPRIEALAATIALAPGEVLRSLSVQENHVPRELPQNVGPRFRYRVIATADTHDLSLREITVALGAATGQLILRTQHDFPPATAVTLAAETMLAVARMAPLAEVVEA